MSIEIPLEQALTVEQAIAAANAAKIGAQQALASIPAVIDAEVGPASAPYIAQSEDARDAALVAQGAAEAARDNALATERRMRQQSLGTFANDAAAVAWAAGQSPAITIVTGTSYLNSTSDIFRYAIVTAGPTITWHDVTEDEAAQAALATASATAAAASLSDFLTKYIGPFNSTPTYVGSPAPWSIGALYWNRLQTKFFVWNGSGWDATDATAQAAASAAAGSAGTSAAIAAGLSASGYTLDGIDAQKLGAIVSAPKGLAVLNGSIVALSSLLSFSSAAKYTVGPDGVYFLNSANSPAWDWSTGRRRLLVEAIGATNLIKQSLDFTQAIWLKTLGGTGSSPAVTLNYGVAPDGSNTSTRVVFNSGAGTSASDISLLQQNFTQVNGSSYAHGIFMKAAAGTQIVVRGAGLGSYTKITATGAWQRVPVVEVAAGTTGTFEIGIRQAVSGTINATATVEFWHCGVELGTTLSSVIPSDASPTARAADIVTAASGLLALLTTAGVSFALVMRGKLATPARTSILGAGNTYAAMLNYSAALAEVSDNAGNGLLCAPGSGDLFTADFGVAVSSVVGQLTRKLAANGHATVSDNYTLFDGSETSMVIGGGNVNFPASMLLDELIVWPVFASNAGLQAQARVYS